MKILFIDNNERSLFPFRKEFLNLLIKEGHEILLAGNFGNKTIKEYGDKIKAICLSLSLKSINPFKNLSYILRTRKIIKEFDPDLLLTYTIKPDIYPNLFHHRAFAIANITGLGRAFEKRGLLQTLAIFLYRKSFKNVNHVMFQNEHIKEVFLSKKIPTKNYSIIPGSGVNLETFKYDELTKHKETNFLFPSRLIKTKGVEYMFKAMPIIIEKYPDVKFIFLQKGNKKYEKQLEKLRQTYPSNISTSDFTFGIVDKYQKCDFVISPSFHNEGISNVLLESLAVGRPIITTNDNYGCKEVLQEGINGFGVKSRDLDSLVSALLKACSSTLEERIQMGKAGRRYVSKYFDRQLVINEYMNVIGNNIKER